MTGPVKVVPHHISGPSIIASGVLVDTCPSVESAERMAAALNELATANLSWALPSVEALEPIEASRLLRHMAKIAR